VVGETGEASAKAAELAAVTTRKAKDYRVSPGELLLEWKDRAHRLGLDSRVLGELLGRNSYRRPTAGERHLIETELAGPNGLTAHSSSFSRRDAIQGFCERLQSGAKVKEIERLADAFLGSESVITLSARADGLTAKDSIRVSDGRIVPAGTDERRYSTVEMLGVEQAVIERSIQRRLDACGVAAQPDIDRALSHRPLLFADQRAMVRRLTTSGLGVEIVVGKAGSGKTFALDAARAAWAASGYRVLGCALSARAARELEAGSGIESYTIAGLLRDLEHPVLGRFADNTVVIVDEAGMVGTRNLELLLEHAERAGAKVVLVGDDRQLPEIEAGGAFRGIKNRLPSIELSEVRRQPFGWERDALELIRDGRAKQAIDAYVAHDRVVIATSSEETRRQLVRDWWDTRSEKEPAVMIAPRRSDADDLNDRARELMITAGTLDSTALDIGGRFFARGDWVMTIRNCRGLGVINGTRGVVENVDIDRKEITFRRGDGATVTLPRSYLEGGHLTHSYAITGHKAQGMTTDKAYVLGDETRYREWTYTPLSRGRSDNRLYVVAGTDPDREELGGEVASSPNPMTELVRAIGRSRAKDLALDAYEHDEIRNLTIGELRREWEGLQTTIDRMPEDASGDLAELQAERSRLDESLRREPNIQTTVTRELNGMGAIGRRRNRVMTAALKRLVAEAAASEARLVAASGRLRGREDEAEALKRRRHEWLVQNAPAIRRFDALGRELWWREQQRAIAAEVAMPQYLTRAVGERPMRPSEREVWHEAVRAIESYRERWRVTDPGSYLGGRSDNARQRIERDAVKKQIAGLAQRPSERELDVTERSIEL
jgi:hypothetical protein